MIHDGNVQQPQVTNGSFLTKRINRTPMNVLYHRWLSHDRRAKEALRIAAGISPWGKVRPTICFSSGLGQAGDPEIRRYFTLLRDTSGGLFTLAGDENDWLQPIDQNGWPS